MFRSIVVGAAGSASAPTAVDTAAELASCFGATLHLVSAVRQPALIGAGGDGAAVLAASRWSEQAVSDETEGMAQIAAGLHRRGISVLTHVVAGDPTDVLCGVARRVNADLVVVGNRGMQGARRMLGSVPNSVSHHAPCSVLIASTT